MDIKVKKLLKDLTNSDDDLRALSAMTLMKLDFPDRAAREEILLNLIEATQDRNVAVRFFARKAIDKIRKTEKLLKTASGETAASDPSEKLISSDYQDRLAAVMEIKTANRADFKDQLVEMLGTEEHTFVRAALISCLAGFLKKDEAGILSRFLSDSDNRVRSNTIEALEVLKAEDSIPALFSALSDPDNRIRAVAAKALQTFGEEKVFAELKKMLESPEEWMKGSAIYALSHIQAGEAVELLLETARSATHAETRVKAIVALANYYDSCAYGFLKGLGTSGEGIFKETAQKALKLMEEKFGVEPPTRTLIAQPEEAGRSADGKPDGKPAESDKPEDLASTVTRFFRKGKEEAVGLSNRAALNFSVTDLKKELDELCKEIGRTMFDVYQAGEIEYADMLSLGHEILRMNFFIQKYTEQEEKLVGAKPEGFFGQLKSLFSKSPEQKATASQAEKFSKRRDELLLKLGQMAVKKYEKEEFRHKLLEPHIVTYQKLTKKLSGEQKKLDEN
ncbi:hypothetical protein MASR1M12_17730 [Erysipelotrichia bacterium]